MDLLQHTAHRPWPLPTGPWVMTQTWNDLLFAHWPVAPERIRPLLPDGVELDTFDGQAWIGVLPFHMSGIRLRGMPPVPFMSAFPELNVRTYVVAEGKPGVWFFSLDATNPVAVWTARKRFRLPYFRAEISVQILEGQVESGGLEGCGNSIENGSPTGSGSQMGRRSPVRNGSRSSSRIEYRSRRIHKGAPAAEFVAGYRPISEVFHARQGTLEHWLTERYCLYTVGMDGHIWRGDIHHLPWPLQRAEAEIRTNTMAEPLQISLAEDITEHMPILHYAKSLQSLIWPIRRARS